MSNAATFFQCLGKQWRGDLEEEEEEEDGDTLTTVPSRGWRTRMRKEITNCLKKHKLKKSQDPHIRSLVQTVNSSFLDIFAGNLLGLCESLAFGVGGGQCSSPSH